MVDFGCGRWTGSIRSTKERIMSVRRRRLAIAAVTAATAIAIPAAALASGPNTPSGKPAPSTAATKPAAASKPGLASGSAAASKSGLASGSAAASKSAARRYAASRSATMSAMVAALATRLGIGHSAAQRALNQLAALGRDGIDPASPAFAALAHDLGVSPAQLTGALRAAKQSVAGI
jgi:hypothetical protein